MLDVVVNQPFMSISFVPRVPRLAFEVAIMIFFLWIMFKKQEKTRFLFLVGCGLLLVFGYLLSGADLRFYVRTFNKIVFGVGFYSLIKNYRFLLSYFAKYWIGIWLLISLWVIAGSITYMVAPKMFIWLLFGKIDPNAPYPYLVSKFGQVFVAASYLKILARSCGVFFEPIQLGLVAWLNIFLADFFFRSKMWRNSYILISIIVGLLSRSGAFLAVSAVILPLFFYKRIWGEKHFNKMIMISFLILINIIFLVDLGSLGSFSARASNFAIAKNMLFENSLLEYILGSGPEKSYEYGKHAFASAYNALLLNLGIIFSLGWFYLVMKMTLWSKILFYSLILYFLMLNPIHYLLFHFLIILGYFLSEQNRKQVLSS